MAATSQYRHLFKVGFCSNSPSPFLVLYFHPELLWSKLLLYPLFDGFTRDKLRRNSSGPRSKGP